MNPLPIRTPGFSGYSVQFSPFYENRLAIAAAQYYGIVGNGKLFVTSLEAGSPVFLQDYDTQDGVFEVAWNESNENQVAGATGDGSVKLWDITVPNFPVQNFHEHRREVYGLHWDLIKKDRFVTGSWDNTIKIWTPERPQSLMTFAEHTACIYGTFWSPRLPDLFASVSGDCTLRIWDTKSPRAVQAIQAHQFEILSMDWSRYNENVVITGSVDKSLKVWDLRNPAREVRQLLGHQFAVRRLKCSPHLGDIVGSVSYDLTTRIWDLGRDEPLFVYDGHTEFATGLDWNLYVEGQIAACSWDETTTVMGVPQLLKRV